MKYSKIFIIKKVFNKFNAIIYIILLYKLLIRHWIISLLIFFSIFVITYQDKWSDLAEEQKIPGIRISLKTILASVYN